MNSASLASTSASAPPARRPAPCSRRSGRRHALGVQRLDKVEPPRTSFLTLRSTSATARSPRAQEGFEAAVERKPRLEQRGDFTRDDADFITRDASAEKRGAACADDAEDSFTPASTASRGCSPCRAVARSRPSGGASIAPRAPRRRCHRLVLENRHGQSSRVTRRTSSTSSRLPRPFADRFRHRFQAFLDRRLSQFRRMAWRMMSERSRSVMGSISMIPSRP